MASKLYTIRDSRNYFRTGVSPVDGTQALCGRRANNAVCLRFSIDGQLIDSQSISLSQLDNDETISEEVGNLMNQLGFSSSTIRIQKFAFPDLTIGIKDLPDYLQEYINAPSKFPKDRAEHLSRRVGEWRDDGGFVLIWDEEYEMNAKGEVEST